MSIELYEHNQTAYRAALDMLNTRGKAAVIHPTGTGKSFIGFKLCEEFPQKIVCWLSPSEYIFRTQAENLIASMGIDAPLADHSENSVKWLENIRFYTYAKLMSMTEIELGEISPDYIILDEFHRCGAKVWGQGVENLLSMYPNAGVLGLSATAIRYLDNQRDMSDELFDGNVASEMSLGEAIVRGILNPPKYVLSVFSYQKDLKEYQKRIRTARSKAVRDEGEKQLDALRRALKQADGLEEIFRKHMEERAGKYIVFCANYEHMAEMITKAPKWFAKVDQNPHIYTAYSDDPATSRAFAEFKTDVSDHLKLLYCIDMLNEGVHMEDVDGVILLRPTVSPIIYKQQIGRALSAGKKKDAVIFDIVLNIENLYSIGTIEEEMQIAASYYHFLNREDEIVYEHFKVADEVQDCIALFEKLEDTLTASWELMYQYARQYYQEHGNLEVPVRYQTEEGYGLGRWLLTQRKVRAGEKYGVLSADRIQKLDRIGMIWGSYRDLSWERYFKEAKRYYEEHGHLNTNVNDVTDSGVRLGAWICQLRTYRKSGIQKSYLTEERIQALGKIGMIWDVPDYLWEENFMECLRYYREHGDLDIPNAYISPKGLKIGGWIRRQRLLRKGMTDGAKLTPEQIARLDGIGMVWKTKPEQKWEKGYAEAKAYYEAYGNLNVPVSYVSPDGYKLGGWIADRREKGKEKHSKEQQGRLDALGMVWVKPDSWEV
ncbi:MAG: DEAD/DEAH box helicase family protein, partial [Dorea sp.]|nr:DEAD/DEAH box helicase family protein [Dorea sp.]